MNTLFAQLVLIRRFTIATAVCLTLFWSSVSYGVVVFSNPITGTNPNTANPYTTGQVVDPNLIVSGIGRGTGINGVNANDRYNADSWNTSSRDVTAYFTWTLTPKTNFKLSLENFVYTSQRSNSQVSDFAFRSSLDSFATNIGSPTSNGTTISLAASTYQNLIAPIEFRFYAWGASSANSAFSINDFTFNGSLVAVPEPSAFLFGGLICGVLGVNQLRKCLKAAQPVGNC